MKALKLHTTGKETHLNLLKQKFNELKNAIKQDNSLNTIEKTEALKKIKKAFIKEKKAIDSKLF